MYIYGTDITNTIETGEDTFLTKPTGYRGMNTQTVGFKAPCLVYYANDYTAVGVLLSLLFGIPFVWLRSFLELYFFDFRTDLLGGGEKIDPRVSYHEDDQIPYPGTT